MDTVYVFLAEGFEEIEALFPVDMLRRAGVPVRTVGLTGTLVEGAHGIVVQADIDGGDFALPADAAMVVLPGGSKGTENLAASPLVAQALREAAGRQLYIAAICAAPTVLQKAGLLKGRRATAFPAVQPQLAGSLVTGAPVEVDGRFITSRAAGTAMQFSHALIAAMAGKNRADEVIGGIYPVTKKEAE